MKNGSTNGGASAPSSRLLIAAFAGLAGACSTPQGALEGTPPNTTPEGAPDSGSASSPDSGSASDPGSGPASDPDSGSASSLDSGPVNTADAHAAERVITFTQVMTMTREQFVSRCEGAGGTLEVHPHCGGVNTCRGFSYDITISTFTEHTCRGLNTCTGYSCLVPEDA